MLPRRIRRLSGCSYEGARAYFVTVLTKQRLRHFCDPRIIDCCATQILRACKKQKFELCASCYMPDHWHALVRGKTADCAFLRFIKRAKQLSGYHVKQSLHVVLWAPGFYDRVVREDEDIMRYVRYIWNNPVVAGLVSDPADYPHLYVAPEFKQLLGVTRDPTGDLTSVTRDLKGVTRGLKAAPTGRQTPPVGPTFRSAVPPEPRRG